MFALYSQLLSLFHLPVLDTSVREPADVQGSNDLAVQKSVDKEWKKPNRETEYASI